MLQGHELWSSITTSASSLDAILDFMNVYLPELVDDIGTNLTIIDLLQSKELDRLFAALSESPDAADILIQALVGILHDPSKVIV